MSTRQTFLTFLTLIVFVLPAHGATIYKWVDKNGVINFTDDYEKVPPLYRHQVQKEEEEDVQKPVPPAPSSRPPPPPIEEERDIYGRGEAWWREKVHPWKEKLREAKENLDRLRQEYSDKTATMAQKGLVSRARYQTETNKYNEEKAKYEAQITEANEMLEKLSKEAKESKANLDWLK